MRVTWRKYNESVLKDEIERFCREKMIRYGYTKQQALDEFDVTPYVKECEGEVVGTVVKGKETFFVVCMDDGSFKDVSCLSCHKK